MNLVSVPVFVLLCFLAAPLPALSLFFIMCAVTGITGAAMNGIPLRMGPINNDGHDIVEMSENSAALRSFWIQLTVVGKTAEGIRLKDMPEKWFDMPEQSELDNSITATCAVFRENRLADLHNFDEAKQLSDELLELETGIIGLHRNLLICDRIYLELLSDKDSELIEKLYSKELKIFMKQMRKFPTIIRTEYAYALLYENDSAKADQIKQRFIVCRKTYPYAADIESELELMGLAESAANRVE